MSIGLAILYGVSVMTAVIAALMSVGAFKMMLDESQAMAKRYRHLATAFVAGCVCLSITFWLAGV